jgi:hypothetical protein
MPLAQPAASSICAVATASACARRAAPDRHNSTASAEAHVRDGSLVTPPSVPEAARLSRRIWRL